MSAETRRIYSPATIAAYSWLGSFPLGVLLFGINVSRRGKPAVGRGIVASAVLLIAALMAAGLAGAELPSMLPLNIVIALGLWKYETPRYERDLRSDARPARWWLPLLVALAVVALVWIWALLISS